MLWPKAVERAVDFATNHKLLGINQVAGIEVVAVDAADEKSYPPSPVPGLTTVQEPGSNTRYWVNAADPEESGESVD